MLRRISAAETGFLRDEQQKRLDYGGKGALYEGKNAQKHLSHKNISAATKDATNNTSVDIPYGALAVAASLIALGYVILVSV